MLLVEWGDAVEELLPDERLRVELTRSRPTTVAGSSITPQGASWALRWERLEQAPTVRRGDAGTDVAGRAVIVVGIDTSTPQVSVAIGTEREILGPIPVAGKARQEA